MSADASFILQELHLYNWGAFAGRHQVAIDPGNSAIIGPTGSGKTTLVDAQDCITIRPMIVHLLIPENLQTLLLRLREVAEQGSAAKPAGTP